VELARIATLPFPPMRVLEVLWSRALSLMCEVAPSRDLVMVRALDSHPKVVPRVLGKPFYVVTGPQA
jgi:hypothetical protein